MESLIVWRVNDNLGMEFWDQIETVANELRARRNISPIDISALEEQLRAVAGKELADEVEKAFTITASLYADAGFALGYHTRANPEWLIFGDKSDD